MTKALRKDYWEEGRQYYGELGTLRHDGDRVQCHVCGRWFKTLGVHTLIIHGLSEEEYKKVFGLNLQTGLVGLGLTAQRSAVAKRRIREGDPTWHSGYVTAFKNITPEQRAATTKAYISIEAARHREEARARPETKEKLKAAIRAAYDRDNGYRDRLKESRALSLAGGGLRGRISAGVRAFHVKRRAQGLPWGQKQAVGRAQKFAEYPELREVWIEKDRQAHLGPKVSITCVICGRIVEVPEYLRNQRTCGDRGCVLALNRLLHERQRIPPITRKCVVCGRPFEIARCLKRQTCGRRECRYTIISRRLKGREFSEEHREKLSIAAKRRGVEWLNEARRKKRGGGSEEAAPVSQLAGGALAG